MSRCRDTIFQSLGLEVLKSRHLEISENGHVSAIFLLWNYFSIQICRKQSKILGTFNSKLQNIRKFVRMSMHFPKIRDILKSLISKVSSRSRHVQLQVSVSSRLFSQSLGRVTSITRLGLEDFGRNSSSEPSILYKSQPQHTRKCTIRSIAYV